MIPLRAKALVLAIAALCFPAKVLAAPDAAAFTRSIGLREQWQYLTRDVAWPARWTADGGHFFYRKTVEGGFAFETVDRRTLAKSAAFDQVKIAHALAAALGHPVAPLRLPFAAFDYDADGTAILFELDGVPGPLARVAFERAMEKLPIKTKVVARFGESIYEDQ